MQIDRVSGSNAQSDADENRSSALDVDSTVRYYQELLRQTTLKIRRTLNLDIIWQQTVQGLTDAFRLQWCAIGCYRQGQNILTITAESGVHPSFAIGGRDIPIQLEPVTPFGRYICRFQSTPEMQAQLARITDPKADSQLWAIVTNYQDEPNGLILLSGLTIPLQTIIRPLENTAEEIGTAIAHACLFSETQNLAQQLQRVNKQLLQKQQELQKVNQQLVQKQLELEEASQQAELASQLKSEFLANTSHELRTPLNSMIGFLKLILDEMVDDPEEQQSFIQEAHRSALHLLDIINDVLDIARIEAGKLEMDLVAISLTELFQDVEAFLRPSAEQKSLYLEIAPFPTQDSLMVYGDYKRILQVLLNLVGNAIKFTPEGGITLSVEVQKKKVVAHEQEWPGLVKIRVADTGIGVPLHKQEKLFRNFSQVDGSRTRQYGGTGLGLAISQRLVQAMGGTVNFFSMGEGLGATVTFTVPLYQEPIMVRSRIQRGTLISPANGDLNDSEDQEKML
jgi:signal transduction histidine kinase